MKWNVGEVEKEKIKDEIGLEIPIGRLCCFKPVGSDEILFGHLAGAMVHNFKNMSFVYLLKCEERVYYSNDVIVAPRGIYSAREAAKYFKEDRSNV